MWQLVWLGAVVLVTSVGAGIVTAKQAGPFWGLVTGVVAFFLGTLASAPTIYSSLTIRFVKKDE